MFTRLSVALSLTLLSCGCAFKGVPANRINVSCPYGDFNIATPKNTTIEGMRIEIASNKTFSVTFEKWASTNDPQVLDAAGVADVARMQALSAAIQTAMDAAVKAAAAGAK